MSNICNIFKEFYANYDLNAIRKAYGSLNQKTLFTALYKKNPFSVELRMKNDVFAMQLNTNSILSAELLLLQRKRKDINILRKKFMKFLLNPVNLKTTLKT